VRPLFRISTKSSFQNTFFKLDIFVFSYCVIFLFILIENYHKDLLTISSELNAPFYTRLFSIQCIVVHFVFSYTYIFSEREQKPLNPYPDNEIDLLTQDFQASPTKSSQNFAGTVESVSALTIKSWIQNSKSEVSIPSDLAS
jgi:uncharacterized membrane protein (DUF485 family)